MDTLLVEGYNQQPFENYNLVQPDPNQGIDSSPFSCIYLDGDNSIQVPDFPDDCLNFISEILMEEDIDDKFGRFHDYNAIQATEQSLFDALRDDSFEPFDQFPDHTSSGYSILNSSPLDSNSLTSPLESILLHSSSSSSNGYSPQDSTIHELSVLENDAEFDWFTEAVKYAPENISSNSEKIGGSKARKNHQRDETDYQDNGRSSKLIAAHDNDYVQMEQYDDVMLWKEGSCDCSKAEEPKQSVRNPKSSKGKKTRAKKKPVKEEVVDLRTMLTLCSQAVSSYDMRNANELIKRIKLHSSQYGDSIERVAHYFACGLEARIEGTGSRLSVDPVVDNRISSSDILKSYRTHVKAIPLRRTSYHLANQTILKMAENATTIHIVDFGIFFGFQWPCFIQCLSNRVNGPPKLRITGIGFPQRGFKPAAVVEETGKRLEGYCKRFSVPFEYQFISKKWDDISPDDIKVEKDEFVVVNCLYESRSLFDDTIEEESPRDAFLKLSRSLNPDVFVHGIINGTFNAPFFMTRFREALFHYSAIFDMLEATIPREDPERLLMEKELYGKAALNVVACEGVERLERPETYKQWQIRTLRAGFTQIPLDRCLVSMVKSKVKTNYHKDFVLGEDGNWMLQGWKGRILYAISCWRPA